VIWKKTANKKTQIYIMGRYWFLLGESFDDVVGKGEQKAKS
jgi:hypothetical protein